MTLSLISRDQRLRGNCSRVAPKPKPIPVSQRISLITVVLVFGSFRLSSVLVGCIRYVQRRRTLCACIGHLAVITAAVTWHHYSESVEAEDEMHGLAEVKEEQRIRWCGNYSPVGVKGIGVCFHPFHRNRKWHLPCAEMAAAGNDSKSAYLVHRKTNLLLMSRVSKKRCKRAEVYCLGVQESCGWQWNGNELIEYDNDHEDGNLQELGFCSNGRSIVAQTEKAMRTLPNF